MGPELTADDRRFIERAARYLERPGFLLRVADMLGTPIERVIDGLPDKGGEVVQRAVQASLEKALAAAVATLQSRPSAGGDVTEIDAAGTWRRFRHRIATGASGATGGFFGLAGLVVELPVTTTVMLRSIASTAQDFGEDLDDLATRMECLSVFSLGGPTTKDDAVDSAYYAVRGSMAILVRRAAEFAAGRSAQEIAEALARGGAPAVARLVAAVASRFNIVVTEKVLATAVPAFGAVTGAFINMAFTEHFHSVARYHFGLRKLERRYGEDAVRSAYGVVVAALPEGRR